MTIKIKFLLASIKRNCDPKYLQNNWKLLYDELIGEYTNRFNRFSNVSVEVKVQLLAAID